MAQKSIVNKENFKEVKISDLVLADWNYKKDNPTQMEYLLNNLKLNGQVENIIVRLLDTGFYEVVNGNHRLKAFQKLGIKKIMVYDLGKISEAHAKRIAVETNETKFQSDSFKLAEIITELSDTFSESEIDLSGIPFSETEIENMKNLLDFDWDDEKDDDMESVSFSVNKKKFSVEFDTIEDKDLFLTYLETLPGKNDADKLLTFLKKYSKEKIS